MKNLEEHKDITHLSNYKTPASARWYFEVRDNSDIDKLGDIIDWSKGEDIKILWVSGGTNMLFAFDEYDGLVIKNNLLWWTYRQDTKRLECYSAESIWNIAKKLEEEYWQDLWHRFIGLPGSVAGAVYGNAWCFWLETESNFESCRVFNLETREISVLYKKDMNFSYRNSKLKEEKKYFIISVVFDLSQKKEKYHSDIDNIDFRENKQPKWNSCGSFFKNPNREQSAGYLIEQVWLKGKHVWWAYFSEKHANFLMHDGSGTYRDMLDLIGLAEKKIQKKFSISLENEVQIIKN